MGVTPLRARALWIQAAFWSAVSAACGSVKVEDALPEGAFDPDASGSGGAVADAAIVFDTSIRDGAAGGGCVPTEGGDPADCPTIGAPCGGEGGGGCCPGLECALDPLMAYQCISGTRNPGLCLRYVVGNCYPAGSKRCVPGLTNYPVGVCPDTGNSCCRNLCADLYVCAEAIGSCE
jgi:hypothetical protein